MKVTATEPSTAIATAAIAAEPFIDPRSEGPIRAELFGVERLEALARRLAAACALAPPARVSSPLLRRFEEDARALERAHHRIAADTERRGARGTDAEWLADNFHIVEDVLREVRQDLPGGYDAELPKLANGPARGYPRVHALALALVAHTDGEIDQGRLDRFVAAFQEQAPLTIGELWALPTMLRLVLIENLRRLADQMLWDWDERRRAEVWSAHHAAPGHDEPLPPGPLTDPFVVRLIQLLRDQGPRAADVLAQLDARLAARGDDTNEVLRREHHRQSANQVSIGNCMISLRLLSALDWNRFFERHSAVESILRDDPAKVYDRQDFATRDRYRRIVERIARRGGADELDVARRAVALAREALGRGEGIAPSHVGYYLIDRGQASLKAAFGYRLSGREALLEAVLSHPRTLYFGSIALVWAVLVVALAAV
ncbi:MAG: glycosyl transferase family 36, partial [Isosphaeraceae bacterium]|nr:glycosyl transferase family 36 [Isosphaeraceae bacterium]